MRRAPGSVALGGGALDGGGSGRQGLRDTGLRATGVSGVRAPSGRALGGGVLRVAWLRAAPGSGPPLALLSPLHSTLPPPGSSTVSIFLGPVRASNGGRGGFTRSREVLLVIRRHGCPRAGYTASSPSRCHAAGSALPPRCRVRLHAAPWLLAWRCCITYALKNKRGDMARFLLSNTFGEAKPGHLLALMGPSGSGKTTLLNVLAGQLTSSPSLHLSGYLYINGRPMSEGGYKIAYVRQEDLFFSQLTVREMLSLATELQLPDTFAPERKENYMVEKLGIEESKIENLGNLLYKNYDTTMASLRAVSYSFDYNEYHSFVHERLPYENIKPDPVLKHILKRPLLKNMQICQGMVLSQPEPIQVLHQGNLHWSSVSSVSKILFVAAADRLSASA
ncbi:hypothetical protein GUJ93_ZPchr0013g35457 [Zizania palustris]|uniref:ABC transporter domain-containing protein n=1 Tax=Zizania palustris TaxID=103762 RepID=A0A8J5WYG5_ZIZPA|nr:hypothetical protein GUJ93_ZPchr0013g35457 [Zizania palustris]